MADKLSLGWIEESIDINEALHSINEVIELREWGSTLRKWGSELH